MHVGGFGKETDSQLSSGFEPVLVFFDEGPSCEDDVRFSDMLAVVANAAV